MSKTKKKEKKTIRKTEKEKEKLKAKRKNKKNKNKVGKSAGNLYQENRSFLKACCLHKIFLCVEGWSFFPVFVRWMFWHPTHLHSASS